jgi:hypothetical protein
MGGPIECWTHSTPEHQVGYPNDAGASFSLADILEDPDSPHLRKYFLSPKAAVGIIRRASRRGRTLPDGLREALESLAAEEQGGQVVGALTTRCGDTQDDQQTTQLVVVNALTANMAGAGGGASTTTRLRVGTSCGGNSEQWG